MDTTVKSVIDAAKDVVDAAADLIDSLVEKRQSEAAEFYGKDEDLAVVKLEAFDALKTALNALDRA